MVALASLLLLKGGFYYVLYSTLLHLPPTDAGIESRTVATGVLAAYLLSNKHKFTRFTRLFGSQML
jgi:hypothetical protein